MKIAQHIPDFIEGMVPVVAEYESVDQLLAVHWIQRWTGIAGFHQFSVSPEPRLLMAELNDGKEWYVVGRFQEALPQLPLWTPV